MDYSSERMDEPTAEDIGTVLSEMLTFMSDYVYCILLSYLHRKLMLDHHGRTHGMLLKDHRNLRFLSHVHNLPAGTRGSAPDFKHDSSSIHEPGH